MFADTVIFWYSWPGVFLLKEQVDVQEGFSAGTTPIQAKSFDVKINVATCLEQDVADC